MQRSEYTLHLLGGFGLCRGHEGVDVPAQTQRLLALLALQGRPQSRTHVAELLWPDTDPNRGSANLRTTLWRLRAQEVDLVDTAGMALTLKEHLRVDVRTLRLAARRWERDGTLPNTETLMELRGELMPGCWDAWLVFERELIRQEAVHLHEVAALAGLKCGDSYGAVLLANCAVECDPLRESANQLLLRALVANGNTARAVHHALNYAALLESELGVPPPPFVEELLWTNRTSIRDRLHAIAGSTR